MAETLSTTDLVARTGASAADIAHWRAAGLLGPASSDRFDAGAVDRVRLIRRLLRRGIPLDAIAAWAAAGELDRQLAMVAPPSPARHTPGAAARIAGVPERVVRRVIAAVDLDTGDEPLLTDEDVEAFRGLGPALAAGLPEDAVADLAQVMWDAMRHVAETEAHLFHVHVRRALAARDLSGSALDRAVWQASDRLTPLAEPTLLYFHRRALRHAIADVTARAVAERAGLVVADATHGLDAAVAFIDLASFTPMTEAMGDAEAAGVLARFLAIARDAVRAGDGHVAKQIGDAVLVVFPDARHALPAVLAIERRCAAEAAFPAVRAAINAGPMIFRAGEYVGTTVNLAARLAGAAERHQVLVTAAVRDAARSLPGIAFHALGPRRFKGLADPVDVWEARADAGARGPRLIDPVCGMELRPGDVAARLSSAAGEIAFCSQTCLRRWVTRGEPA